uniref:Uncharacterized protein n=1 Tax=Arundo donax TaxID=35708 RepID=A0A0A9H5D8_ARUDO
MSYAYRLIHNSSPLPRCEVSLRAQPQKKVLAAQDTCYKSIDRSDRSGHMASFHTTQMCSRNWTASNLKNKFQHLKLYTTLK